MIRSDPLNAFCAQSTARLKGAPGGPLSGLTFAAKDLFDIAGHVTGAGNPDWLALHSPASRTAEVVQALVDAGADMVGKTHTDELSRGILGENVHYGTPTNPKAPGRVPGGSSSGSAAAVSGGLVDFALGTDTGGSVRIPASFCGIFGIRPSHGRLSLAGVVGQAPSFDTVGWFAREADLLARLGEVLLGSELSRAERPRHLIIASDAFAIAEPATGAALCPAAERMAALVGSSERRPVSANVPLADWFAHQRAIQGREAWETFGDWIDRNNPRFAFEVADNFLRGMRIEDTSLAAARAFQAARRREALYMLAPDTIVCLPTAPFPAPPLRQPRSTMWSKRTAISTLTCIAGTLRAPQLSLPAALVDGFPVGLSLLARPGGDEMLLAFARDLAIDL
ncbi:MAG TPA: amidase [Xanthobacteraceae bacterium]|jgi:amidase